MSECSELDLEPGRIVPVRLYSTFNGILYIVVSMRMVQYVVLCQARRQYVGYHPCSRPHATR